ncbi:hypothetical protein EFZ10_00315 [Tatumella sp. TA1]|uniref:hypothetical protein n=1 Tax=Rosenbergiella collisarenosi TaxID=1544695 RepID=UPI0008F8A3DF|nr:hypothetical protein [Rosenbergiella collisarenosi]QGX90209.1 hypothetical protein EFZ10_00315 [Tatumella sp. TA1]
MNKINLLNWRRRKLAQRTCLVLISGIILLIGLIGVMHVGCNLYQRDSDQLLILNKLYQQLSTELAQRLQQQRALILQFERLVIEKSAIDHIYNELTSYSFFFIG